MRKDIARKLMMELESVGECLDRLSSISLEIDDDKARYDFRKNLGLFLADWNTNLVRPIILVHPDLDPEKEGENGDGHHT